MSEPCHCPAPNPDCRRAGLPMIGRLWELCADRCPEERPCPGLSEQYRQLWDSAPATSAARLVSFVDALTVELAWRAGGGSRPSPEDKAARRRTCAACDKRDPARDLCTVCGCYLESNLLHLPPIPLGKLDCATQRCPLGLWGYAGGYAPANPEPCCNKG